MSPQTPPPDLLRQVIGNLVERLDSDLLPTLYRQASLSTEDIVADLDSRGEAHGRSSESSEVHQLEATSERVIRRACRRAAARGALAGAGGLFAVPPEAAASAVQTLRLAQRLVVVWGHDPQTDLGQIHLARTLAAAFQVELPEQGPLDMRLSDLPRLALDRVRPAESTALVSQTGALARVLAVRSAVTLATRFSRWIPGVGAGLGAIGARRSLREQGQRMVSHLRGARSPRVGDAMMEDAVEVR